MTWPQFGSPNTNERSGDFATSVTRTISQSFIELDSYIRRVSGESPPGWLSAFTGTFQIELRRATERIAPSENTFTQELSRKRLI